MFAIPLEYFEEFARLQKKVKELRMYNYIEIVTLFDDLQSPAPGVSQVVEKTKVTLR